MKAVIVAAGKGTRLLPYTNIVPKPLIPIGLSREGYFSTIIERLILQLAAVPVTEIYIIINYKGDMIENYLGDGKRFGCRLSYIKQPKLDGNAGAFYCAHGLVKDEEVVISDCDNFIDDFNGIKKMAESHWMKKSDITIGTDKVSEVSRYAIIKTDKKNQALDIVEKPSENSGFGNLAKSGVMILSKDIASLDKEISQTKEGEFTTTQIVKYCIGKKKDVNLFRLKFRDIGTWGEYIPILKSGL